jgi:hypothetical protein
MKWVMPRHRGRQCDTKELKNSTDHAAHLRAQFCTEQTRIRESVHNQTGVSSSHQTSTVHRENETDDSVTGQEELWLWIGGKGGFCSTGLIAGAKLSSRRSTWDGVNGQQLQGSGAHIR